MRLRLENPLVMEYLARNAGDGAHKIAKSIEKKGFTDEQISRRTKMQVNDIRAALNKLHNLGIITYSKEKAKNSNWYTYTWFLEKSRIGELIRGWYEAELDKLNEKLSFEQNYVFFKCVNGCEKLPFELAYEYDFKCPECGREMEQQDNAAEKVTIEKKIADIKKFLSV
jgi:transcription initiation factor TFIIE subunit alpha